MDGFIFPNACSLVSQIDMIFGLAITIKVICLCKRRNCESGGGSTTHNLLASRSRNFSRNSTSNLPRIFMPESVSELIAFAPKNGSRYDSSTIGLFPVDKRSSPKFPQFCANLTRKHQRMIFTVTVSQSDRESLR